MTETKPVLIVGAGPAGLVAAITLARYGVASLLIEKRSRTSPLPRATGISTRSMEIFRSWGLEPAVRAGEMDVATTGWVCASLADPAGLAVSIGFPSPAEALAVSPTAPAATPQDHLEPVLLQHLRGYGLADVRFGAELTALDTDDHGATAVIRTAGRTTTVRCSYVVGADGAHSLVRESLGIAMHGPGELGDFLAVLFRAPLAGVVADRRHGLYMIQESAVFVPVGDGDRWLYSRNWDPATERWEDFPAARVTDLIRAGAGVADLPVRILRIGSFTFAAQIAERYRRGRAFLVGDAAHRITPRGGTGMNTAVHDAYDLAWKLGWVLRGWAPEGLLDSYQEERLPVGARNAMNSATPGPPDPAAFADDLGGRLPHSWLRGTGLSTLDLLGPGFTVLTGPGGTVWRRAAEQCRNATAAPLDVHPLDDTAAFEIGHDGAVLVRPDGRITERWHTALPDPAAVLRDAVLAATRGRTLTTDRA
ncbi:FAD-dependent monooxygenase [Actinoplanes sp. URMC 104]|uniref:FAD-dependent monooxygenase n=1 Tax=Actinoplanes sp. URMC 104 TaxID=3423409 RepID=UPI003F1A375C